MHLNWGKKSSTRIAAGTINVSKYKYDISMRPHGIRYRTNNRDAFNKAQRLANEIAQWLQRTRRRQKPRRQASWSFKRIHLLGPLKPPMIHLTIKLKVGYWGCTSKISLNKGKIDKVRKKFTVYIIVLGKIIFLPSETFRKIYHAQRTYYKTSNTSRER